jgi:hypothetical protein
MIMYCDFGRVGEELVAAYFDLLSPPFSGGTDENHKNYARIVGLPAEI